MELLASVFCEDILAEITMCAMSISDAIAAGDLKALQLLAKYMGFKTMAEKCSAAMIDIAARHGHLDMVKWLAENRSEGSAHDAMNKATKHGHPNVAKWLLEHCADDCTIFSSHKW